MSETKNVKPEVNLEQDESAILVEKAKGFWQTAQKPLTYMALAIVVVCGGYLGYKKFYVEPREEKAYNAIWHAQQYFEADSITLAINGDGQYLGFEKVTKNFPGTEAGNLAGFYAGICALKLKDYNKAISYLKKFNTKAKEVQAIAFARMADAYSELKKNNEAVEYYAKAGYYFPELEALSAENLYRAGALSEVLGKKDDAIKYYKEIKEKYSRTERGYQIDKYLARLGVLE